MRQQFDELRRAKTPAKAPAWLHLYVRALRYRQSQDSLDRIWVVELRRFLENEFQTLLSPQTSPDDPRWEELADRVERIAAKLKTAGMVKMI